MYADYGGFGQAYFEGDSVADPHPAGYTMYRPGWLPFDAYAAHMATLIEAHGIDPSQASVLVAGCAYGYTVQWLRDTYGTDAWGMDVSQWAVDQASTAITDDVVRQGDVRSSADLRALRQESPGGKFDVIFIEAVLSCLTDSEAQTGGQNCRGEASRGVVHRVWATDGSDLNTTWYNGKTLSEWQALVDPDAQDDWHTEHDWGTHR